jgi:hypothetical protein
MSNEDSLNLEFLLTASSETLLDWFTSADDDDLEYANELLQAHGEQLNRQEVLRGFHPASTTLH